LRVENIQVIELSVALRVLAAKDGDFISAQSNSLVAVSWSEFIKVLDLNFLKTSHGSFLRGNENLPNV
jgi:hypothetical protein